MQRKTNEQSDNIEPIKNRHPVRVDRKVGARIVTQECFPISPRTLERWPLKWRRINGRALVDTKELLAEAQRRVDEAYVIKGGRIETTNSYSGDEEAA